MTARAQAVSDQSAADPAKTSKENLKAEVKAPEPLIHDLLGVTIGMTAADIKKKLGKPASADATGMYFQKDGPDVQLQLGSDGKAEMIALMYSAGDKGAPELAQVLGPDYKPDPPQNGRIYEALRYPAAGYSIRYSRSRVGDGNMTIITMERIKRYKIRIVGIELRSGPARSVSFIFRIGPTVAPSRFHERKLPVALNLSKTGKRKPVRTTEADRDKHYDRPVRVTVGRHASH
jgi:hypothetical protein